MTELVPLTSRAARIFIGFYLIFLGYLHMAMFGLYEAATMPWLFFEFEIDTRVMLIYAICVTVVLIPVNLATITHLRSLRPAGVVIKPTVPAIFRCAFWSLLLLFVLVAGPVVSPYFLPPYTDKPDSYWLALFAVAICITFGLFFTGVGLWGCWDEMKRLVPVLLEEPITEPIPVQTAVPAAPAPLPPHKDDNLPDGLTLLKFVCGLIVLFVIVNWIKERRMKH